jgi:hypothetical protein
MERFGYQVFLPHPLNNRGIKDGSRETLCM